MDAVTLARAMGCPQGDADRYVGDMNAAMLAADCTTVRRAAMWCAQVGHESSGLHYMEEIASGQAYEGRASLGNTQPGDGRRFKGRGPIQLTGRANYGAFGSWCAGRRLAAPDAFLQRPQDVATSRWGFLAAAWYWTVARPRLNGYADAGDVLAATKAINGGTNGLADRQRRWDACLRLDRALLPTGGPVAASIPGGDWFDMATREDLKAALGEMIPAFWGHPIPDYFTDNPNDVMPAFSALGYSTAHGAHARADIGAARLEITSLRAALAGATAGSGQPLTGDQVGALIEKAVRDALDRLGPLHLVSAAPAA